MYYQFDYDSENDDLFIYLDKEKSAGAIEFGNLIIDFNEKGNLVAMQVINATEFFSKILSKFLEISKIKSLEAKIIKFRNIDSLKIKITTDKETQESNVLIPRIQQPSPALLC